MPSIPGITCHASWKDAVAKLTRLACEISRAERVRLTLDERATLDSPLRSTRQEAACPIFVGLAGRAPQ